MKLGEPTIINVRFPQNYLPCSSAISSFDEEELTVYNKILASK